MFVGLDVDSRFSYATVLDEQWGKVRREKILNSLEELDAFIEVELWPEYILSEI